MKGRAMERTSKISKILSREGYDDVLFLRPEDARKVLTQKRLEIIRTVESEKVDSIRGLARKLDRKENVVYEDLELLFEEGIIDFEEKGNRKIPILRHKNVMVYPIVVEGEENT